MIARLTGKVIEREEKALIIDANGVGYRVGVLSSLLSKVRRGSAITLRVHHHLSETEEALYGFAAKEDLYFFELLLTVPSVGPKTAMGILEIAPPRVLEQAVAEQDTALLTKVSGVGKKTAQRILVELREKVKAPRQVGVSGRLQQEALEALVAMGYTTSQARQAVSRLPAGMKTVEDVVRAVLQREGA